MRKPLHRALSIVSLLIMVFLAACDQQSASPTATTAPKANTPASGTTGTTPVATKSSTTPAAATTPASAAPTTAAAATPSGPAKELKIGVIAPMSGAAQAWGQALERGVILAADDVNKKGGVVVGGERYLVKVVTYDDKYTGDGGVAAATRLVNEDKVKFIIGSIASASVLAFQPVTEPAGVLVLPNTYSAEVLGPNKPFTVRIVMTSKEYAPALYKWLKKAYPNYKTMAHLEPNDITGKNVGADHDAAAKAAGIEIVSNETYERGTTDFYPVLTKMLAKKPDVIDLGSCPTGDVALLNKQARELGYKGFTMTSGGQDAETLYKLGGDAVAGHISPIAPLDDPKFPKVTELITKYKAKWTDTFNSITLAFYDPALALFASMEKTNSLDPAKVRDTLIAGTWEGAYGPFSFAGKESYGIAQQIYGTSFLGKMVGSKQELIETLDLGKK